MFRNEQERVINETIVRSLLQQQWDSLAVCNLAKRRLLFPLQKDIAKYRQNGARQDALGDFCNVALLFLQFLSVLVMYVICLQQ